MATDHESSRAQQFYESLYEQSNYQEGIASERVRGIRTCVERWMERVGLGPEARVLEVGAGHGALHDIHPRWQGLEYSAAAVSQGKSRYGEQVALRQGDATAIDEPDASIDFLFTIATLEHVPDIEKAFTELERVLAPGGTLLLAPAWNCRPWTVAKLTQRPFESLSPAEQVSRLLIPLRESLPYRIVGALPARIYREAAGMVGPVPLQFRRLQPSFELIRQYGHVSDDDAFISMDAHAALMYLAGRGLRCLSHPTARQRFFCRAEPVAVHRPKLDSMRAGRRFQSEGH
jgi:SAM-dependent methyltransferase